jgi:hypothetical protein
LWLKLKTSKQNVLMAVCLSASDETDRKPSAPESNKLLISGGLFGFRRGACLFRILADVF